MLTNATVTKHERTSRGLDSSDVFADLGVVPYRSLVKAVSRQATWELGAAIAAASVQMRVEARVLASAIAIADRVTVQVDGKPAVAMKVILVKETTWKTLSSVMVYLGG